MSPEDPSLPSSPATPTFPPSLPTITDALLQGHESQSTLPPSQSLNRQFPHSPSRTLECHSPSLSSCSPAVHAPGHLAQGPNLHLGSQPSGFLQQQMPDVGPAPLDANSPFGFSQQQKPDHSPVPPDVNSPFGFSQRQMPGHGPAPLDTHSSFPLSLDDTNSMACTSFTSLNPDSLLMNPPRPMSSHPSPLTSNLACSSSFRSALSTPPNDTLTPEVISRSSWQTSSRLLHSSSQITAQGRNFNTQRNAPIATSAGYRYITPNMPILDPSHACSACLPSYIQIRSKPQVRKELLRHIPLTDLRSLLPSDVPSQVSQPTESSTVQRREHIPATDGSPVNKRQRITTISETSNLGNGDGDTPPSSHPGIQIRNPSPPTTALPITNSDGKDTGNVAVPSPNTIQGSPISNPRPADLFELAYQLGRHSLAKSVRKAYEVYAVKEAIKKGRGDGQPSKRPRKN